MKLGQGNVFTDVCDSVHRGGLPQCILGYPPRDHAPPPREQSMLGDTVNGHPTGMHPTGMQSCYLIIYFGPFIGLNARRTHLHRNSIYTNIIHKIILVQILMTEFPYV